MTSVVMLAVRRMRMSFEILERLKTALNGALRKVEQVGHARGSRSRWNGFRNSCGAQERDRRQCRLAPPRGHSDR